MSNKKEPYHMFLAADDIFATAAAAATVREVDRSEDVPPLTAPIICNKAENENQKLKKCLRL